ncbi:MAG: tRNA-dihydrouridine synthase family protein, partial [Coriobacteriales bacterium]|nr:tRNA-dihydrouridine synthase family protein [Coriobacteriales bacterium]
MKLPDIQNHAVLAPMAGVNDPAFRAICKRMGAGLTYTEMISSKGLQYGNKKTRDMLVSLPEEGRLAVQLFGHEPDVMADAAKWIAQQYSDKLALIDVNMGCPVRKIAGKGDGAALMDEPELAASIVRAMAEAVPCPITVKFRLHHDDELPLRHSGLDPESTERADKTRLPFQATCAFAALMQDAGASAICVHGRTAGQMYRGSANRDIISYVARAVDIPV